MFRWLRRRPPPPERPLIETVNWCLYRWRAMPLEPRVGSLEGVFQTLRVRTWAGCTIMVGEEASYPRVPVLECGEVMIPLKRSLADPALRDRMLREAAAWRPRPGYVGAGPPYVRDKDPWFVPDASEGSRLTVRGFWYPAFCAGTIQGWQIWGISVDELA